MKTFANAVGELTLASKGGGRRPVDGPSRRHEFNDSDLTPEAFRTQFSRLLDRAPEGVVKACHFVGWPAAGAGWIRTDIEFEAGARVTAMATRHQIDSGSRPCATAPFRLGMRVGSTEMIFHDGRNTRSFIAPEAGRLHVMVCPLADSPAELPKLVPVTDCNNAAETISMVAIRWKDFPLRGLRYLANVGDVHGLIRAEIDRLCSLGDDGKD